MERYLTRRYVAVTSYEAQRLAQLDGTPIDQIQHTPDVYLVHRTEWWAWWSDECLTGAISFAGFALPGGPIARCGGVDFGGLGQCLSAASMRVEHPGQYRSCRAARTDKD